MGIEYKVDIAGLGPFAAAFAKATNEALGKMNTVRKEFITEMSDRIVDSTPVDTGRAKFNNQIAVNTIPQSALFGTDKDGTETKQRNKAEIEKSGMEDTVHLYNQVTYVDGLEHGTSKQAPNGFYGVNIGDAESILDAIVAKHKA
ncbi:hypothetical protein [Desulfolutivibrio sp.]|uniref:hypothetical protein n=1 Tax=Desulfolutivibrio sp. TaxID=2773296 RepID=UPI002F962864